MKEKKVLFLFLALLLPVCVFLFLKIFGTNQFDVAPLHQEKDSTPEQCEIDYSFPYVLPDSVMEVIREGIPAPLYLLSFTQSRSELNWVLETVKDNELHFKDVSGSSLPPWDMGFLKNCILLLPPGNDVVLIDREKRIRGYYKASDRKEMDRLQVEIKIILHQY